MKCMQAIVAVAIAFVAVVSGSAPVWAAADETTSFTTGPASSLLRAAFGGDVNGIETLLARGIDVNAVDEHGYTGLIWAAQQGQTRAVAILLAHGAKTELTDLSGYTALIWASQQGHPDVVARLIVGNASLVAREKHGYSALDWAVRMGQAEVVKQLLVAGADPNAKGPDGHTALELAARSEQQAIFTLMQLVPQTRAVLVPAQLPTAPVPPHYKTIWQMLGHSAKGAPIPVATIGNGARTVLLIGTIHGDEAQGEDVIKRLLRDIEGQPGLIAGSRLIAVPVANPDGKALHTRGNARGVDLNRNFPTHWIHSQPGRTFGGPFPLSEPESRLLRALIERERPSLIVSFHAAMMCNNFDGVAAAPIARAMSRSNGYRLLSDIGYPTPGSLGQEAAYTLGVPIITLEVGHEAADPLYAKVRQSLVAAFTAPH